MEQKESYTRSKIDMRIEELCSQYAIHTRRPDAEPPTWPIFILEGDWYLWKFYLRDLYETIRKLRKKMNDDQIAELFKYPSRIAQLLFYIPGFHFTDMKRDEKIYLVNALLDFIAHYRKKDIFCLDGRNIIWDDGKISQNMENVHWFETSMKKNFGRLLGMISSSIWFYCQFIHTMYHAIGHEFHGSYDIGKNDFLLVREYYDLTPVDVWPFTSKYRHNKIRTLEVYDKKDVKISIEFFGHIEHHVPLPPFIKKFAVSVDNNPIMNEAALNEVIKNTCHLALESNNFTKDFFKKDWVKHIVSMRYYILKPLRDSLGVDWHPSQAQMEFIKKNPSKEFYDFINVAGKLYLDRSDEGYRKLKELVYEGICEEA